MSDNNTTTPRLVPSFEIKSIRGGSVKDVSVAQKRVTGYLSHFNNFDAGADMVMPGAFAKSISDNGPDSSRPRVKHLWQHDPSQIIGKLEVMVEDKQGLYFESSILDTQLGNDILKYYEAGVVNEHSIGYKAIKQKWLEGQTNAAGIPKRELLEIKLFEGSSVTWGMNDMTPFTGFKSLSDCSVSDELATINDKITRIDTILHKESISDEFGYELELLVAQLKAYVTALETMHIEPVQSTQLNLDTRETSLPTEPQNDTLKSLLSLRDALVN